LTGGLSPIQTPIPLRYPPSSGRLSQEASPSPAWPSSGSPSPGSPSPEGARLKASRAEACREGLGFKAEKWRLWQQQSESLSVLPLHLQQRPTSRTCSPDTSPSTSLQASPAVSPVLARREPGSEPLPRRWAASQRADDSPPWACSRGSSTTGVPRQRPVSPSWPHQLTALPRPQPQQGAALASHNGGEEEQGAALFGLAELPQPIYRSPAAVRAAGHKPARPGMPQMPLFCSGVNYS